MTDKIMQAFAALETAGYQGKTVFKSGLKRDVKKAVATLGFEDEEPFVSEKRRREIKDAANLYIISKIEAQKSHGTPIEQIMSGLCNEIYLGAVDGLKGYGYIEESKVMLDIFKEVFFESCDEAEEFWKKYFRNKIKEES